MGFTIEPVEGENYEGRQWGYRILSDGRPYLHVTTGGTGTCWNVEEAEYTCIGEGGEMEPSIDAHVCELDEFIGALEALRDSPAHAAHVARWS